MYLAIRVRSGRSHVGDGHTHSTGDPMRPDDPAEVVLMDDAAIDEIDRAIVYAIESPELDPRIRDAFINALLDKRNRATLGA